MPNWVTNRIRIKGSKEVLEEILKKHVKTIEWEDTTGAKRRDEKFDFNTIIPEPSKVEDCPEEYRLDLHTGSVEVSEERPWFNWYAWRCSKWGTKWNAHDTQVCGEPEDGEIEIWFETAWSPTVAIYERFALMHPDVEIEAAYVEEQGPYYTGVFGFRNGECVSSEEPEGESKRAHEIMFDLWGNQDAYEYDAETDNYKYIDEEVVVDTSNDEQ